MCSLATIYITLNLKKDPSIGSNQVMLAKNEQRATIPKDIIHKSSNYDTDL